MPHPHDFSPDELTNLRIILAEYASSLRSIASELDIQTAPLTGGGDCLRKWERIARALRHRLKLPAR